MKLSKLFNHQFLYHCIEIKRRKYLKIFKLFKNKFINVSKNIIYKSLIIIQKSMSVIDIKKFL